MNVLKKNWKNIIGILAFGYIVGIVAYGDPTFYKQWMVRHYHDGLYITSQQIFGISSAWIIEGDEIEIISTAGINKVECSQSRFEIEVYSNNGTEIFRTDNEGNFILLQNSNDLMEIDQRMLWVNGRTDYKYHEVLTLLDTAYLN